MNGWDRRQNNPSKFSIIIHSTNGKVGTSFDQEERFLLNSRDVSAHFLIGKNGQVTQFFDDIRVYRAWHAGEVRDSIYSNNNSIGIECHYTPSEDKNMPLMMQSLTGLCNELRLRYTIVDIEAHRNVAVPKGRKIDPSFLTDIEFYTWKENLSQNDVPILGHSNANIDILRDILYKHGVDPNQIVPIVCAYTTYGELTGIGNLYPLAQAIHETDWFKSERWLKNNNPAGLGATNDGAIGTVFNTISEGILAQYAHLLVYATKPDNNSILLEKLTDFSPRKEQAVKAFGRGSATTWQQLNGKWASPGKTYGQSIVNIVETIIL